MTELGSVEDAGLRLLADQMRAAGAGGQYFAALLIALTLPDMCGALASENGRASRSKYRAWLVANLHVSDDHAQSIYDFRCSPLHQGSAHPQSGRGSVTAFIEPTPSSPQLHNLTTDVNGERVGWMSVPMFVEDIAVAVDRWFARYGDTSTVQRNLGRFVKASSGGIAASRRWGGGNRLTRSPRVTVQQAVARDVRP